MKTLIVIIAWPFCLLLLCIGCFVHREDEREYKWASVTLTRYVRMVRVVDDRRQDGIWQTWEVNEDRTTYLVAVLYPTAADSAIGTVVRSLVPR